MLESFPGGEESFSGMCDVLDGWLECPASCFLAIWSPCLAGGISFWLDAVVRCEAAGVVWVVL